MFFRRKSQAIRSADLSGDHCDLGYGSLCVSVDEFSPVSDDPTVLLPSTGEEPGHVHESHQGDVKSVAEPDEASTFHRCVNVKTS